MDTFSVISTPPPSHKNIYEGSARSISFKMYCSPECLVVTPPKLYRFCSTMAMQKIQN